MAKRETLSDDEYARRMALSMGGLLEHLNATRAAVQMWQRYLVRRIDANVLAATRHKRKRKGKGRR